MRPKALIDTSVWLEYLINGKRLEACKKAIEENEIVGIPAIVLFEFYRKVSSKIPEEEALRAAVWLRNFGVLAFTAELALEAVDLSLEYNLCMADSIILAHSQREQATLITLDNDFASVPSVKVLRE